MKIEPNSASNKPDITQYQSRFLFIDAHDGVWLWNQAKDNVHFIQS